MKKESKIKITASDELSECRLDDLAGREAVVDEILYTKNGSIKGCWVTLVGSPYLGEPEWYIPVNSITE